MPANNLRIISWLVVTLYAIFVSGAIGFSVGSKYSIKPTPTKVTLPRPYKIHPDEVRVLETYKFEGSLEGTFTPDE